MRPILTTPAELEHLSARCVAQARIGLDTEFLRERTYRAELCLVQLSTPEDAVCVDPLVLPDLAPLARLLGSPAVLKVMHASRQDLEVLLPVAGLTAPVLDTQIAASLAGLPAQTGYAQAVRRLLGIELAKSHTRTDWSRRPLSAAQLDYALDDVRYLLPLAQELERRLAGLGRMDWLAEELAGLADARMLVLEPAEAWRRIRGLRDLDPARARLARALGAWREERAVQSNRPRGWILDDAVLREIVMRVPRDLGALGEIPGIPAGVVQRRGAELVACVAAVAVSEPAPVVPARSRPDPAYTALVKKLVAMSQAVARELDLAPEVLATRRDLEELAAGRRDGPVLCGWRRAVLGERLLAAL